MKNNILLDNLRKEIDALDEELLSTIAKRMEVVRKIEIYKKQNNLPAMDMNRWKKVLKTLISKAKLQGIRTQLVTIIWNSIHKEALRIETEGTV